jgi:hypothetical protein
VKYISKVKVGPKGKLGKPILGRGMLGETIEKIKKRKKKQKEILDKIGK